MSQANVQVVRQFYEAQNEAFNERDFRADLWDPAVEVDMSRRSMDPEIYRGLDEVRRFTEDIVASFGSYEVVVEDVLDAGEKLVAMLVMRGQGALSGVAVEVAVAHVLTFRDGKVLHLEYFGDRKEALRSLGLE